MLKWLRNNFEVAKVVIYSSISVMTSVASIVLQSEFKTLFVSSVFDIGFEGVAKKVVKSTSGILERHDADGQCRMKIVLPFDFPPPAISPKYLCSWEGNDKLQNALCYTNFECGNIELVHRLSLVAPSLFLFGYFLLAGVLLRRIKLKRIYLAISFVGVCSIITGFIITKSIPYVTDYLLEGVFSKIRSVTIDKGGVNYLEFETIKYVLDREIAVARNLIDIMAGFSFGFIFMIIDRYRKTQF